MKIADLEMLLKKIMVEGKKCVEEARQCDDYNNIDDDEDTDSDEDSEFSDDDFWIGNESEEEDIVKANRKITDPMRKHPRRWVEYQGWEGICKPVLVVKWGSGSKTSYRIDDPLPQELYDMRIQRDNRPDQSSEVYYFDVRLDTLVDVYLTYRRLSLRVQRKIAKLSLDYFETEKDADDEYMYARCVKTRLSFIPRIGIHMIFIARPRCDTSTAWLFSAHLYTDKDRPEVCYCDTLMKIDADSCKGKPRCNNVKVSLKQKDIACPICAMDLHLLKAEKLKMASKGNDNSADNPPTYQLPAYNTIEELEYLRDFFNDDQELGEQDHYEDVGLNDSAEDERDLDQITKDRCAAEMDLEARDALTSTNTQGNPQLLHDQDLEKAKEEGEKMKRKQMKIPDLVEIWKKLREKEKQCVEEADVQVAKKQKIGEAPINSQCDDDNDDVEEYIDYGEDEDSESDDKYYNGEDLLLLFGDCEEGDSDTELSSNGDLSSDLRPGAWTNIEWEGLRPVLVVEEEGGTQNRFRIDDVDPLPQKLYDAQVRFSNLPHPTKEETKEEFDKDTRLSVVWRVSNAYRRLSLDAQKEIAELSLAYFKTRKDVESEYEYVRCIKILPSSVPCLGIHVIFTAHRQGDTSTGWLFSAHLYTANHPPEVRDCKILKEIDARSVSKGKPRCNKVKVPLKPKDIACPICLMVFRKDIFVPYKSPSMFF